VAALGLLAGTATALARRARTLSAVAPGLRRPDLWLPLSIGSALELRLARRLFGARVTEPVAGVTVTQHDVPGGQDVYVHEAAPARRLDLSGLPPAWIGVGGLDLFHDEDVAYARRLRAAGVPVELHVEPGTYHADELELQTTVAAMRAFQQAAFDALGAAVGARAA
jgi:acetyl esterase/lipase